MGAVDIGGDHRWAQQALAGGGWTQQALAEWRRMMPWAERAGSQQAQAMALQK